MLRTPGLQLLPGLLLGLLLGCGPTPPPPTTDTEAIKQELKKLQDDRRREIQNK